MLLFLPGLICDARIFAPQLAAFPDSRAIEGYGLADSLPAMARIVLDQAPDTFDLFGHSMGGRIALEVYRLAPERVVGSAVIDLSRAFLTVAAEVKAGTFRPRVEAFGLASGVVRYVPNPALESMVGRTLRSRVQAAADSIAAGTLLAAPRPASMQALAR